MTYIAFKGHTFAKIKFHLSSTGPFVYSTGLRSNWSLAQSSSDIIT